MGYTPENNPYIPGDPYSYDLAWMVEEVKKAQNIEAASDENRKQAEAWATGTIDGVPVTSDEPQYHNSAKYWSDDSFVSAEQSEAWAVGTIQGIPVTSDKPQYENNSKYYADEAASDAQTIADQLTLIPGMQNDINVLEARVDSFASLPPGSTAGNAELLDIRIGANAVEYASAGDAVRGQTGVLIKNIEDLSDSIDTYVPQFTTWTAGEFDASGYQNLGSTDYKYSIMFPAGAYRIFTTANLRWKAFYYVDSSTGTQIYSYQSRDRVLNATDNFIITIAKQGGGSLTGLEDEIALFKIGLANSDMLDIRAINKASDSINTDRYENISYIDRFNLSSFGPVSASDVYLNADIRFKNAPGSICMTTNSGGTSSEMRINFSSSFTIDGTQEFELYIYIPDAVNITGCRLRLPDCSFTKTHTGLSEGWNKIRFTSEGAGSWDGSAANTQIRVLVYHTSGLTANVYIGGLVQVKPDYANIIVIADGPYYTMYTDAYPQLKSLGIPVVWAIDPTLLDDNDEVNRTLINMNELETLAYDGLSEFSFHSYDGTLMSTATAEQALKDTLCNIRFLQQHGLQSDRIWRAAWLQNDCDDPSLANQLLDASASYDGTAGLVDFPFPDKYNIPRYGLNNSRDTAFFDTLFDKLEDRRATVLVYFHGISNEAKDLSSTLLTYFINKLSTAISAGYLNPTTYSRLMKFNSKLE